MPTVGSVPLATNTTFGVLKGDGSTFSVDANGIGHALGGSGGVGTVTSVAATAAAGDTATVTNASTTPSIVLSRNSQSAKTFLASPNASSGSPTYRTIVATDVPEFGASGGGHASGIVPDPGSSAGTTKFLREDKAWSIPNGSTPTKALDYTETADLYNAVTIMQGAWADVGVNHNFAVTSASSLLELCFSGFALVQAIVDGSDGWVAMRLLIDSAGTPISKGMGGCVMQPGTFDNPMQGGSTYVSGLSVATHTVKVQIQPFNSRVAITLQAATIPDLFCYHLVVVEHV